MRTITQSPRWYLLVAVVLAIVLCAALLLGVGVGSDAGSTPNGTPEGPVTDAGVNPWAANDPALVTR